MGTTGRNDNDEENGDEVGQAAELTFDSVISLFKNAITAFEFKQNNTNDQGLGRFVTNRISCLELQKSKCMLYLVRWRRVSARSHPGRVAPPAARPRGCEPSDCARSDQRATGSALAVRPPVAAR